MKRYEVIIMAIGIALAGLVGFVGGRKYESIDDNKPKPNPYFVNGSENYLNQIKLDLPEEISTVRQQTDSTLDLMTAFLDTKDGVIYLGFSGKEMNKNDHLFITEHSQLPVETHEYQFDLDMDSLWVFEHNRFIGKVAYANTALDSIILKDNDTYVKPTSQKIN